MAANQQGRVSVTKTLQFLYTTCSRQLPWPCLTSPLSRRLISLGTPAAEEIVRYGSSPQGT